MVCQAATAPRCSIHNDAHDLINLIVIPGVAGTSIPPAACWHLLDVQTDLFHESINYCPANWGKDLQT